MLDPIELLGFARTLAAGSAPGDAELRRGISAAYYAVFHATLKIAAGRFVGSSNSGTSGYAILYRGFSHGRMNEVCRAIDKPLLGRRYQNLLRRTSVPPEMREFARAFLDLQELRHIADYDPQAAFLRSDLIDACDKADVAMQALCNVGASERTDILALLLIDARG